jgi:hypothetical protein
MGKMKSKPNKRVWELVYQLIIHTSGESSDGTWNKYKNPFLNLKLHLFYITLRIKTKTISHSVFSSQILQNMEINIVVH